MIAAPVVEALNQHALRLSAAALNPKVQSIRSVRGEYYKQTKEALKWRVSWWNGDLDSAIGRAAEGFTPWIPGKLGIAGYLWEPMTTQDMPDLDVIWKMLEEAGRGDEKYWMEAVIGGANFCFSEVLTSMPIVPKTWPLP